MTMQKKYPFKFLDAYTRQDADIFFGRTAEIEQLYEMVFQTDLLLVYGASGTGKTSLIQCGLASRFQSCDWMPLFIRRGSNLNTSFEEILDSAGGTLEAEEDELAWLDRDFSTATEVTNSTKLSPLAQRLKAIYLQHFKPIYLIFDQFEELYILGNKVEQQTFIDTVREVLKVEQPVKIIISIREEYLGYLYEFERKVPELLRKKLRVEPMNFEKVKTVVQKIGSLPQSNVRLAASQEGAIAEGIFEKIRGDEKTLSIQLPYLQVFLDKLYMQITKDESRRTEATFSLTALKEIGNIGDVLRNFLDEQVLKIAREKHQAPELFWAMLSPFVTLEGTKEPMSEAELQARLPKYDGKLIHDSLQAFWKGRILRYNEQAEVYEIMHDSLAKQIHAKRSDEEIALLEVQRLVQSQTTLNADAREYFSEKQLEFIAPYEAQLNLDGTERQYLADSRNDVTQKNARRRRRQRLTILATLVAFAMLATLAFWALQQRNDAVDAKNEAQSLSKNLQAQTDSLSSTLERLEAERAAKAELEFEELKARANTILDVGGCPEEILQEMQQLATTYKQRYGEWENMVEGFQNQAECD